MTTLWKSKSIMMALIVSLTSLDVIHAEELNLLNDLKTPQQASEYIFRSSPKEALISVQLLGAVNKPGVYYVPVDTDLLKLLTLAGGSTSGGDVSEVVVRKQEPKSWNNMQTKAVSEYKGAYEVDAEKIIKYGGSTQLKLAQDDFVYVPQRSAWVTSETSRNVTIVSVAMGIVLTGLLIQKNSDHR